MTIQQILREKNLSRYQLSKISGVPWSTLADICSGRTALTRCNAALQRISARIDLDAIQGFLESVPALQPIQREFYLTMLTERKEKILDYSLNLLLEQERHKDSPSMTM